MLGGKVQPYRRKSDAQCMGLLSQCICTYWHSYKCPGHSYVSICLTAVQAAGYVTVLRGSGHLKYMQSCSLQIFRPPAVRSSLWTSTALFWLLSRWGNFHSSQSWLNYCHPALCTRSTFLWHGLGCLSICLWRWSEENTELIHNKNVRTRSSASIFPYPLSWRSSSTPHIYHQWLSALRPFPICFQISDREVSPQENYF